MCETEEANDRPKWLLELENRKRKPRLAHEAGAGAPCMICSTACPGLDLHFWRKICKNCKCSRDDHDVDDDDFPQFDLLFGSAKKYKRKPIILHVNNEKQHEGEAAFEWVPPDTTKELATDYMKALPAEKLPIKGSAGAALRRQLLQKQLPLHDIDHKVCDELSEQEKKQFEKYLENIKKYVGQGKVTKILGARPFDRSLMTPANATDMQRFSPQHKPNIPGSTVQLRTPSSFTPKSTYAKTFYENQNKQIRAIDSETDPNQDSNKTASVAQEYNVISINNNSETVRSEPIKAGISNNISHPIDVSKFNKGVSMDERLNPLNPCTHSKGINAEDIAESILADALLPPSTVHANDIIGSTLDEERLMFIREKLSDKYSNQENQIVHNVPNVSRDLDSSDLLRRGNSAGRNAIQLANMDKEAARTAIIGAMKNSSGTSTITEDGIERALKNNECKPIKAERETTKPISQTVQSIALNSTLINNANEREKFTGNPESPPKIQSLLNNSTGSVEFSTPVRSNIIYSEKLHNQIFPHEAVGKMNQETENLPNLDQLTRTMGELVLNSMKPQQKCHNCQEDIRVGDVVVTTDEAKNASWHPGCFVCNMCNELLVDLVYFNYKDKLYCGRDLATLLGIPRCFACDELIFVREYTVAEGHNYHVKHFCCWDCDVPLAGQQYITESDRPLCLPCYQKTYAKSCNACSKVIKADQQGVTVKNFNFHATDECFCCYTCKKNLLNGRMAVKEEKLFCSKECISMFLNRSLK